MRPPFLPLVRRRASGIAACAALLVPLAGLAHLAACSSDNGTPVGSVVYDASPLEPPENPPGPDGSLEPADASGEAAADAGADAKADTGVDAGPPVVINEIYVDLVVRGDSTEYIELRGTPNTPVDDLKLRILYADGSQKYLVNVGTPGARFSGNGLWVVGGQQTFRLNVAENVDMSYTTSEFGLDSRGAVQLLRGTTLLDVVGYGPDADAGAVPPPSSPPTATSEGKPVQNATQPASSTAPARSVGRRTGAADTNVNAADFCAMEASPGFAQKPCP